MVFSRHRSTMLRVGVIGPWRTDLARRHTVVEPVPDPLAGVAAYDQLLVTFDDAVPPVWADLLARGIIAQKSVRYIDEYLEAEHGRVVAAHFAPEMALGRRREGYRRRKLFLDRALIVLTLPLTLLIAAIVSLAIGLTMGSPVLFVQTRLGRGGREFPMWKFRTMRPNRPGALVTTPDDARVTRLGRVLRRCRIDELPQLRNVWRGDMSLVGPRPEQPALAAEYARAEPAFAHRLLVLPGITGLAQVTSGYAGDLAESRIKLGADLYYIKYGSHALDAQILMRTIWTVFRGLGAR